MIKTYLFLSSRDGADPFRNRGAEAARSLSEACPSAAGYTQTRTLAEQVDPAAPLPFSGVAELCFRDAADALAVASQPEALASLFDDSVSIEAAVTGEEHVVLRLADHHLKPSIKGVFPFRRLAALSVGEFQRYWLYQHGPIAAQTEEAVAYLQCHPLSECYESEAAPAFDGVTELHWGDVDAARRAMASRQMREDQAQDAEHFAEPGSVLLFLAEEEVVTAP